MNERRIARLAAWFAISNLGHTHNMRQEDAGSTKHHWARDPNAAVCDIAGHLMEDDSHERLFGEEADGWYQELKHLSIEEVREKYSYSVGAPGSMEF
jgi:hypothetical protein